MSAWILGKRHIDALVTGIVRAEVVPPAEYGDEQKLGQALWDENYHSVNIRYREDDKAPEYVFERHTVEPSVLHNAAHCYLYQCAEYDGWDQAQTAVWVTRLCQQLEAAGTPRADMDGWPISDEEAA